jgi:nickel-type superoxide dismutase maturation protease
VRDGPSEVLSGLARLRRALRSRRVRVEDQSMAPGLLPGDRLRVDPGAYRHRPPQVGEIVVLTDPERRVRWLVKRVAAVDVPGREIDVRGDERDRSRDSRAFGPVPFAALAGRAYRVYFPPDRRRPL